MPHVENDGLSLYYEVHGLGAPVVMLHGAAVSFSGNYGACGWIDPLTSRGLQVIGLDFRGHGGSDAPSDKASSGIDAFARDAVCLLDELSLEHGSLVGYSIGSAVALHALHTYPDRFTAAALVATGDGLIGHPPQSFPEILPLLDETLRRSEFPADLPPYQAMYWTFAEQVAGDRKAVAMGLSGDFSACTTQEAATIEAPVLVVSGENDPVLGTGARLAEALPNGRYLQIPGADHFSLAIDETVQKEVAGFLAERRGSYS